jgi:hypothetical protein
MRKSPGGAWRDARTSNSLITKPDSVGEWLMIVMASGAGAMGQRVSQTLRLRWCLNRRNSPEEALKSFLKLCASVTRWQFSA